MQSTINKINNKDSFELLKLCNLNLSNNQLKYDKTCNFFAACPNLEILDVSFNIVGEQFFSITKETFKKLKTLKLHGNNIQCWKDFVFYENLEVLRIDYNLFKDLKSYQKFFEKCKNVNYSVSLIFCF